MEKVNLDNHIVTQSHTESQERESQMKSMVSLPMTTNDGILAGELT